MRLEQTADDEYVDDGGYPTDAALQKLREWHSHDLLGAFAFLRSVWWAADWGWHEEDARDEYTNKPVRRFHISTGGWSGNEDAIAAFSENFVIHSMTYVSHRRGGHYVFEVQRTDEAQDGTSERQAVEPKANLKEASKWTPRRR